MKTRFLMPRSFCTAGLFLTALWAIAPAGEQAEPKTDPKTVLPAEPKAVLPEEPKELAKADLVYTGTEACKPCHPEAYKLWTGSHHARSFVVLGTELARKIAVEPGAAPGMPSQKMMRDCSPCHAIGTQIPMALRGEFHPEDGVQCETCHGPGPRHIEAANKPDYKPGSEPELRTRGMEACMACHKEKKTHGILGLVPFDYKESWPRIDHRKKPEAQRAQGAPTARK